QTMKKSVSGLFTVAVAGLFGVASARARQVAQPPSAAVAQAASQPKGDAEKGKTLFKSIGCFQCHANEAQGGAAGPRIGPDPLPFARFVAYVRAPRGEMPPYTAKVLS